MTACVKNHSKRVALAISASLVGALSLGAAAPAVAFAANEGVSTLATEQGSIARGTVKYAHNYKDGQKFTYTDSAQGLVPTTVLDMNETGAFTNDIKFMENGSEGEGYYYFYVDVNGADNFTGLGDTADVYYMKGGRRVPVSGAIVHDADGTNGKPSAVGTYAVVVGHWTGSSWEFVNNTATFSITARSLDDAVVFQGEDPADTTINYTGKNGCDYVEAVIDDMGVTVDGGRVLDPDEDFDIEIWDDGARAEIADGTPLVPGTEYIAKIKGTGAYSGEEKDVRFTYEKLDLSAAAIVGAVVVDNGTGTNRPDNTYVFDDIVASVDGIKVDVSNTEISSYVTDAAYSYKFISSPDDDQTSNDNGKGVYTYEISAAETDPYVKGTATVQVMFVDHEAAIDFGNGYLDQNGDKVFQVDLNADDVIPFTTSGIKVTYTDEGHKTKQLAPSQYKITDLEGNVLTDADFTTPGTRYVKVYVEQWVTANDGHTQHLVGGYDIAKVVTSYTVTEAADVFFSFDGENVESAVDAEYTGSDMTERMAFKVYAGDKVLEQGTDYKVVFEAEDAEGKRTEVDEVVDAGIYYVTVEGISYSGTAEFTLTVMPMKVTKAVPVNDIVTNTDDGDGYLMYTGDVIAPSYIFFKDGKRVEVPEGSYVVDRYDTAEWNATDSDWSPVKRDVELKAVGDYLAYFSTAEDTKNFDFENITAVLHVTDKGVFTDVPMGEWYSQYVYDAVKLDYMNGYKGTELFGPSDGFTRAQAAIVLFNMAGGTQLYPEFSENSMISYETSFSDVDPNAWYAYAVKWCEETGIVKGYPNGEFGVDDPITREQFAVMLANYATKAGVDVAAAKADLSAYPDAGSIDSWAYEAMEWAVSEGVMGGNVTLNPTDGIQRAEVAKMAVTYQPERPETGVIPRP